MDIVDNILSEEDIGLMSDDTILALGKLLGRTLATLFDEYLNIDSGDEEVKRRVRELIGKDIEFITFPEKMRDNGVLDAFTTIKPFNMADMVIDYDDAIEKFKYMIDNRSRMHPYIKPRSKEDYEEFLALLADYDATAYPGKKYLNVKARVEANKSLFYTPRENEIPTAAKNVIGQSLWVDVTYNGLKFLKYADENNLSVFQRRRF